MNRLSCIVRRPMRIWKLLHKNNIFLKARLVQKEEILKKIAEACHKNKYTDDPEKIFQGLETRENTMSTGVGKGIALPHTTNPDIKKPHVFLIHLAKPVDFSAIDNKPVDIILAMIIPESDTSLHLQILARVSRLCMKPDFLNAIRNADTIETLQEKIKEMEEEIVI